MNFEFLDQLCHFFHETLTYTKLLQQIQQQPKAHSGFTIQKNLFFFQDKIWIPSAHPFTSILLEEFHQTHLGGHMGVAKTLHQL